LLKTIYKLVLQICLYAYILNKRRTAYNTCRRNARLLYPRALNSCFVTYYDSQYYGGGVLTNLHGQSVSQYVLVSGTTGPMTRFYFFLSFAGKLLCSSSWGAPSDERTGLLQWLSRCTGCSDVSLSSLQAANSSPIKSY
jgi:hypothetical protein